MFFFAQAASPWQLADVTVAQRLEIDAVQVWPLRSRWGWCFFFPLPNSAKEGKFLIQP